MALMACNSCGHLANHLDVAPQYSAITFGISNTIVSLSVFAFEKQKIYFEHIF
jgi:hypothetical protein